MPEYGLEAFASALRESLGSHGFLKLTIPHSSEGLSAKRVSVRTRNDRCAGLASTCSRLGSCRRRIAGDQGCTCLDVCDTSY
jgi:hypothetical protein